LNGNRSNYGLQTPIGQVVNDAANGYGGFASFIFNPDPKNQFALVGSVAARLLPDSHRPQSQLVGNSVYPS
jgi:hypothetical protein